MNLDFSKHPVGTLNKIGSLVLAVFLGLFVFAGAAHALIMSPVRTELSGNPGDAVTGTIKAINSDPVSRTFYTNVQTFEATDETGNPTFRVVKSDLATWIKIPDSITVGPKDSQDLTFTISVPANAEPGGYFAAIFLTQLSGTQGGAGQVSLNSQIGSLVLFRVNGYIQEGADILEFDAINHKHWYSSLPVTFYYRFQNSGQSWVRPLGDIVVQNFFHHITTIIPANPDQGNVLPQSIRRFQNTWGSDAVPPAGFWSMVSYQWHNFALWPIRHTFKYCLWHRDFTKFYRYRDRLDYSMAIVTCIGCSIGHRLLPAAHCNSPL